MRVSNKMIQKLKEATLKEAALKEAALKEKRKNDPNYDRVIQFTPLNTEWINKDY